MSTVSKKYKVFDKTKRIRELLNEDRSNAEILSILNKEGYNIGLKELNEIANNIVRNNQKVPTTTSTGGGLVKTGVTNNITDANSSIKETNSQPTGTLRKLIDNLGKDKTPTGLVQEQMNRNYQGLENSFKNKDLEETAVEKKSKGLGLEKTDVGGVSGENTIPIGNASSTKVKSIPNLNMPKGIYSPRGEPMLKGFYSRKAMEGVTINPDFDDINYNKLFEDAMMSTDYSRNKSDLSSTITGPNFFSQGNNRRYSRDIPKPGEYGPSLGKFNESMSSKLGKDSDSKTPFFGRDGILAGVTTGIGTLGNLALANASYNATKDMMEDSRRQWGAEYDLALSKFNDAKRERGLNRLLAQGYSLGQAKKMI